MHSAEGTVGIDAGILEGHLHVSRLRIGAAWITLPNGPRPTTRLADGGVPDGGVSSVSSGLLSFAAEFMTGTDHNGWQGEWRIGNPSMETPSEDSAFLYSTTATDPVPESSVQHDALAETLRSFLSQLTSDFGACLSCQPCGAIGADVLTLFPLPLQHQGQHTVPFSGTRARTIFPPDENRCCCAPAVPMSLPSSN